MENSYEYKYLKYKLKYLKIKYELEGAGFFSKKSKLDKAMDKVYEKIAEYIETSAYEKGNKTLKKNLKKIFTKNPLIGKTEQTNFKTAKKAIEVYKHNMKVDLSECKSAADPYFYESKSKAKKIYIIFIY